MFKAAVGVFLQVVSFQAFAGLLLLPVQDAYVHRAINAPFLAEINWDDPNRSGFRQLRIGGNEDYDLVTLMQFDLTGVDASKIAGDGLLMLRGNSGSDAADSVTYLSQLLNVAWNEKELTWNSIAEAPNGPIREDIYRSEQWIQTLPSTPFTGTLITFTIPKDILVLWASKPEQDFGFSVQSITPLSETLWYSKEVMDLKGLSEVWEWAPMLLVDVRQLSEPSSLWLSLSLLGLLIFGRTS